MAREMTLAIVKPDAVKRNLIGEVIRRIEQSGLQVAAETPRQQVVARIGRGDHGVAIGHGLPSRLAHPGGKMSAWTTI